MKVTFDTTSDFNAEYALPGYGCVVRVNVKDGIVNLTVEDDLYLAPIQDYNDYKFDENLIYDNISSYDQDSQVYLKENDSMNEQDANEDDAVKVDDEPKSKEKKFVEYIASIDKDGVILDILDKILNNKVVDATKNKLNTFFNGIEKELSNE